MKDGFPATLAPRRGARVATVVAFAALVVAPLVAGALTDGTPAALLSLPAESIVAVLILLAIANRRVRWLVAAAFGVIVVIASVVAALDLGFEATVDRTFSPVDDWPAIVSAFGVVGDATGTVNAYVIVGVLIALLIAAVFAIARAALRAERVTVGSGRTGRIAAAIVTGVWIVCALAGVRLVPGIPFASADAAAALAATSAQTAQSIRDEQAFASAVGSDAFRDVPGDQLLSALKGKDVVVAFLESYGKVAVQDSTFSGGVDRVLQAGDAQLSADGYSAQSAFLTSPTFGGVSWLAHSTLQSGVWIDSQQTYDRLIGDRPAHHVPRVQRRRMAHGLRRAVRQGAVAGRPEVLRLRRHDGLAQHGLPGSGVQLRAHPRPVHLAALLRRRALGARTRRSWPRSTSCRLTRRGRRCLTWCRGRRSATGRSSTRSPRKDWLRWRSGQTRRACSASTGSRSSTP